MSSKYCKLLSDILLKYDQFSIIPKQSVTFFCQEIDTLNIILIDIYNIIDNHKLNKAKKLDKILEIKDPSKNPVFTTQECKTIYKLFENIRSQAPPQTPSQAPQRGGTLSNPNQCDRTIIPKDSNKQLEQQHQQLLETNKKIIKSSKRQLEKNQQEYQKQHSRLNEMIQQDTHNYDKQKQILDKKKAFLDHQDRVVKSLKKQIHSIPNTSSSLIQSSHQELQKEKQKLVDGAKDLVKKGKLEYKRQKQKLHDTEDEINQQRQHVKKIHHQIHQNKSLLKDLKNKSSLQNHLNTGQKELIDNDMDMMETLLICLSLLPIAGWTFDFPLFVYSLIKKKYSLAIITVLNWYIWGFWLIFGLNINMGPSMKVAYMGNKQNYIKNSLINNVDNPQKQADPYTNVDIREIDGKKYLTDKKGRVYAPLIKSPEILGVIDKKNNKLVKKKDPNYLNVLQNN